MFGSAEGSEGRPETGVWSRRGVQKSGCQIFGCRQVRLVVRVLVLAWLWMVSSDPFRLRVLETMLIIIIIMIIIIMIYRNFIFFCYSLICVIIHILSW